MTIKNPNRCQSEHDGQKSHYASPARVTPATALALSSAILLVALILTLVLRPGARATVSKEPLIVYCAAGIKTPVETIARAYEKKYGSPVQLQFGGSQTLLVNAQVSKRGDLYLPGDDSYIEIAQAKGLIAETIPLARMAAVLAVRKGNPKNIRASADLLRADIKLAQANPDAAAIGKLTRAFLQRTGQWNEIEKRTTVFKPTVNDVANDIKLGTVDAGFIWDQLAKQYPDLEAVVLPELAGAVAHISVGVLRSSAQPRSALHFARYLSASDRGLKDFAQNYFTTVAGDPWAETPELILYSGAVNRVAVEETLKRFQEREGVRITTVYNGCGILVGQMKAGGRPDAYLTCDKSFVAPVADLFPYFPIELSSSAIVILARKGNPNEIKTLADLGQPGLRVGLAHPQQSTLGALTERMLKQQGIHAQVMSNVVTQVPTADLLVNQMRAGAMDATVVYLANTTKVREHLDIINLTIPGANAVQTFSIGANSRYKQLAQRLLLALQSAESRARYEAAGFSFLSEPPANE
ncbi:MAG: substrate-binding domain-containing protein [Lentisphaerae bacterium]|nr:substrate-binding domain-containing protein [Lentisphaerota bacterium]